MADRSKPARTPNAKRSADPIDLRVAERVRQARMLKGVSQQELGEAAGVTFQQVQKYEKGVNRIAPSRLARFAEALDVTPGWFFEEGTVIGADDEEAPDPFGSLSPETVKMARQLEHLPLPVRRRLMSLATALAEVDMAVSEPAQPLRAVS